VAGFAETLARTDREQLQVAEAQRDSMLVAVDYLTMGGDQPITRREAAQAIRDSISPPLSTRP
jgi:hypothetical protein